MAVFTHSFFLRDHSPALTLPNGTEIIQDGQGYYYANALWNFAKKRTHWGSSKAGKDAISDAEKLMERTDLYRPKGQDGTYIHPILLLSLAKWAGLYDHLESQISAAVELTRKQRPKRRFIPKRKLATMEAETKEPAPKTIRIPARFRPKKIAKPAEEKSPQDMEVKSSPEETKDQSFSQLILRDNSNDPSLEAPLEPFQDKMPLMDFIQWCLVKHKEAIDESFIREYIGLYVDMSWEEQATSCCIEIDKLIEFGSYCTRYTARDNITKYGFVEGRDYSFEPDPQPSRHGGISKVLMFLTPDCFKKICMMARGDSAKRIQAYYIIMEKIVREYAKYEVEYSSKREEFFRTGAAGNSQAITIINDLRVKLKESNDLILQVREKNKKLQVKNKELQTEIRLVITDQRRMEAETALSKEKILVLQLQMENMAMRMSHMEAHGLTVPRL